MKPMLLKLFLMAAIAIPSGLVKAANGNDGSGGAGTVFQGNYSTFYGVGLYVEPIYLTDSNFPEMKQMRDEIRAMDLNPTIEGRLIEALMPSFDRKFLKVKADQFNRSTYDQIKQVYRNLYKDDRSNVAVYAVTDGPNKKTYLLPEFFKLSYIHRMVYMFHETLWVLYPHASYFDVARLDMYLENYLVKKDVESKFQFIDALDGFLENMRNLIVTIKGDWTVSEITPYRNQSYQYSYLGSSLRHDLSIGALDGLVVDTKVSSSALLGQEYLSCIQRNLPTKWVNLDLWEDVTQEKRQRDNCKPLVINYFLHLSEKYPRSLFIKRLTQSDIEPIYYKTGNIKKNDGNAVYNEFIKTPELTVLLDSNRIDTGISLMTPFNCNKKSKCTNANLLKISFTQDGVTR